MPSPFFLLIHFRKISIIRGLFLPPKRNFTNELTGCLTETPNTMSPSAGNVPFPGRCCAPFWCSFASLPRSLRDGRKRTKKSPNPIGIYRCYRPCRRFRRCVHSDSPRRRRKRTPFAIFPASAERFQTRRRFPQPLRSLRNSPSVVRSSVPRPMNSSLHSTSMAEDTFR